MNYIVEEQFVCNNMDCVIIFHPAGHRCGYVGIPKEHPWYGKTADYETHVKLESLAGTEIGDRGVLPILHYVFTESNYATIDILLDVHGGVTYSGGGKDTNYPIKSDNWWFGFDCGHYGDAIDEEALQKYFPDRYNFWYDNGLILRFDDDIIRTKEYVHKQCVKLSDQLIKYWKMVI